MENTDYRRVVQGKLSGHFDSCCLAIYVLHKVILFDVGAFEYAIRYAKAMMQQLLWSQIWLLRVLWGFTVLGSATLYYREEMMVGNLQSKKSKII